MDRGIYVWRTGLAEIHEVDESNLKLQGAILVARGSQEDLQSCLVTCRLMRDGSGRYLVNGIPEANDDEEAADALEIFELICENRLSGKKAFEGVVEMKERQRKRCA